MLDRKGGERAFCAPSMSQAEFAHLALNTISAEAKDIFEDIFTLPRERRGFAANHRLMVTPIYFYRIIGVENRQDYKEKLLLLNEKLLQQHKLYLKVEDHFDKSIDSKMVEKIMPHWMCTEKLGLQNGRKVVEGTLKKGILSDIGDTKQQLIKDKLAILLDIFMKNQKNMNIVKNFYIKILYWIEKYALSLIQAYEYGKINPKVLFYGDIQRDEVYFLILLSLIGCDILYFNPQDGSKFNEVQESNIYSKLLEYDEKMELIPFPQLPKGHRQETVARRASIEIDRILHTEEGGLYRPWQFEDYKLFSTPLQTTYEELFILWKEQARFRQGFKVEAGSVYIPNIFAKISGTTTDINEYLVNFNKLKDNGDMGIFIDKIPIYPSRGYALSSGIFDKEGKINRERVKSLPEYRFGYLRSAVQDLILDKIDELVNQEDFFAFPMTLQLKAKCLYTILTLEKKYLDLLQKFDYPHQLPKLVIFDGDEGTFTQEDLIVIGFLHFSGFDIVIVTPTGYNNIENGINCYYYDIHKLENFTFDLDFHGQEQNKKTNGFKKIFSRFF
ncbi:YceG family protein [Clostridium formicaceticum]|uniref:Putative component of 'biosynthetic module' domain-containing protein n=2 Tax=Clostridium formicaceticum TaxID=1497 RepID=A0AAC9RN31_9CLOT|nr:YceG family protein [Clostridium formicaceticum]ARE88240.1 hypothetical protein CLFO_26410 [Clostridium formicaceticum]